MSDVGIVGMAALLTAWAVKFGVWNMMALYMGPLAVTNCWLVMYTWLQHTDVSRPLHAFLLPHMRKGELITREEASAHEGGWMWNWRWMRCGECCGGGVCGAGQESVG